MPKEKIYSTAVKQETAVLVSAQIQGTRDEHAKEYLDELAFLVETAGAKTVSTFTQKLQKPNSGTYVGEGKLAQIVQYIEENEIDLAVFDDSLSPSQLRNLEEHIKCKIMDRNGVIMDIFAQHARTAQAKIQVELAQNQYLLPRLTRMWTHLQKQKGGIGMRGPGEREIETDRRVIRDRIALLKEKLEDIDRMSNTQRKSRQGQVRAAIVGYTNVGKSTLMNLLSKSVVLAENKLFATLDTTVRKVVLNNIPILMSDTVGFIRKLPHQLVECFKSTLDEVREADFLIHVVDVSHPSFEQQIKVVETTLAEIGAGTKPVLMVFNKTDRIWLEGGQTYDEMLQSIQDSWMAKHNSPAVFVSAAEKTNMDKLREAVSAMAASQHQVIV